MAPIRLQYKWTTDDMAAASGANMRTNKRYSSHFYSVIVAVAVAAVASIRFTAALELVWIGLAWLALLLVLRSGWPSRLFGRKTPFLNVDISWEIDEQRLYSRRNHGDAEGSISWQSVQRVVRTRKGFLVYPQPNIYHWLPLRGFQDPGQIEEFCKLAKSKAKEFHA